ncbi:endonuclease MutS2 [Guptibacillus hwajinpoensis]|uniref:endonuclease MutS2 n=1 Tax=Guptibacillus hwajinpoensis TaxID=208199 RepID=UPI0037353708
MNTQTFETLEFNQIVEDISSYALTNRGKESIKQLRPSTNQKLIERWLEEVEEGVAILNVSGSVPLHSLNDISLLIEQGKKGLFIRAIQFSEVLSFLEHCTKLKRFMKDKWTVAPTISLYADSIEDLSALEETIHSVIKHGQIDDYASKTLLKIRKQLSTKKDKLKERIEAQAKKYSNWMQESRPVEKSGRQTLPIKREYRKKINGSVIDQSSSGATLFIEPKELANIHDELQLLHLQEEQEVEQLLYGLTGEVLAYEREINIALETMHQYDIIFSKAKYSRKIDGITPAFSNGFTIDIKSARHPLLGEKAVPLTLNMMETDQSLLITGPNTGGKTVTLKTVGLLCMMAQSGIPIPTAAGTVLPIFQQIFVDIGDGQSLEENLSTFSSRLVNLIDILRKANDHSLLLLDEIGSGTDPGEGMGLATAILDQLAGKGSTILATTHYSEMKQYANEKPGFINGAMEFDLETLQPTYQLLLYTTGKSQAFAIAHKLGLHPDILKKASMITYNKEQQFDVERELLSTTDYQQQVAVNRYGRKKEKKEEKADIASYEQGDNVIIQATEEMGIVYKGPDDIGNYIVQVQGEKKTYNHKRLRLHISANELYPEDYDFDIIFKSKDYRKTKKLMGRKYLEGLTLDEEE